MPRSPEDERFVQSIRRSTEANVGRALHGFLKEAERADWCTDHAKQAGLAVVSGLGAHVGEFFARVSAMEATPRKALSVLFDAMLEGMDEYLEEHNRVCGNPDDCPVDQSVRQFRAGFTQLISGLVLGHHFEVDPSSGDPN